MRMCSLLTHFMVFCVGTIHLQKNCLVMVVAPHLSFCFLVGSVAISCMHVPFVRSAVRWECRVLCSSFFRGYLWLVCVGVGGGGRRGIMLAW